MRKKTHDFVVLIEKTPDGMFIAKAPDLAGCYTQGKSIPQVLERIKEAIQVCLEAERIILPKTTFVGLQKVQVTV